MTKANNQVWVSPDNKCWKVYDVSSDTSTPFKLKREAVKMARELAREFSKELVIQNRNGKISQKDSFGNDPRDVKG